MGCTKTAVITLCSKWEDVVKVVPKLRVQSISIGAHFLHREPSPPMMLQRKKIFLPVLLQLAGIDQSGSGDQDTLVS